MQAGILSQRQHFTTSLFNNTREKYRTMFTGSRTRLLSWWHETPLPDVEGVSACFQTWNHYEDGKWLALSSRNPTLRESPLEGSTHDLTTLNFVTWNMDSPARSPSGAPSPSRAPTSAGPRMTALLYAIESQTNPDVVFLQEVNREALAQLLDHPWIKRGWYCSDVDGSHFGTQKIMTVTLLARRLSVHLGNIWRVALPSRYYRYALCCDIFVSNKTQNNRQRPVRLLNVHLDSMPINPCFRPRQLSIAAKYLETSGRGIVAGDFNPVMSEDEGIVADNRLVDSWSYLCPQEAGFTWGFLNDKPFPPNRMDKVAILNVTPESMRVLCRP